jgi:hypothetical protein
MNAFLACPVHLALALASALLLAACGKSEAPKAAAPSTPAAAPVSSAKRFQLVAGQNLPALEALPTIGTCSVECLAVLPNGNAQASVKNTYSVAADAEVKFIGFAANKNKGEPLARFNIILTYGQVYAAAAESGLERPDVVDFFKKPGLLKSGFQAEVSLKGIPPGEYVIMLGEGDGPVCPTHQKVKIG